MILSCLVIGFLAYSQGQETERQQSAPHAHASAAKVSAKKDCIAGESADVFDCIYDHIEASQETARTEQDLDAQQLAARSAQVAAAVAFVTLFVSGIGLIALLKTIDLGREANEISREGSIAQQRAWIKMRAPDRHTVWVHPDCLKMHDIKIVMENIGQSVALSAHAWGRLFAAPLGPIEIDRFSNLPVPSERGHCQTIWPNEPTTFELDVEGDGYEADGLSEKTIFLRVFLTVAVEYWTVFDNQSLPGRRSEQTFEVKRTDLLSTSMNGWATIRIDKLDYAKNVVT